MRYIDGDLIKLFGQKEFDIIVHGCNCFCSFGAGIARTIAKTYPSAFEADLLTESGDASKLGTFTIADVGDSQLIINAYTQFNYVNSDDSMCVDYDAVKKCFRAIKEKFGCKGLKFGIPLIGAGLAGGDWDILSNIIETEMKDEDITVVKFVPQ